MKILQIRGTMPAKDLANRFLGLAWINVVFAVIFTAVVLDPFLCVSVNPGMFGCRDNMVTSWPGTWLFISYFIFLICGVLGTFGWAGTYYLGAELRGKSQVSNLFSRAHILLWEVGVFGAAAIMAAVGYVGGGVIASGGGAAVAAEAISLNIFPPLANTGIFSDMPVVIEAVFIVIGVLGALVGVLNYIDSKPTKTGAS